MDTPSSRPKAIVAVTGDDPSRAAVLKRAASRRPCRAARRSSCGPRRRWQPLESPLPTDWSGDGEQEQFGDRLGPNDLVAAGARAARRPGRRAALERPESSLGVAAGHGRCRASRGLRDRTSTRTSCSSPPPTTDLLADLRTWAVRRSREHRTASASKPFRADPEPSPGGAPRSSRVSVAEYQPSSNRTKVASERPCPCQTPAVRCNRVTGGVPCRRP